jgi:hypothetical protein
MSEPTRSPSNLGVAAEVTAAEAYIDLFVTRRDDFAVPDGKGGWARTGRSLTVRDVTDGLAGGQSISTYSQADDGSTHVLVIDFDVRNGLLLAVQSALLMWATGIPAYVEPSRVGRAHLVVVLDERISAAEARRFMRLVLKAVGVDPANDEGGSNAGLAQEESRKRVTEPPFRRRPQSSDSAMFSWREVDSARPGRDQPTGRPGLASTAIHPLGRHGSRPSRPIASARLRSRPPSVHAHDVNSASADVLATMALKKVMQPRASSLVGSGSPPRRRNIACPVVIGWT